MAARAVPLYRIPWVLRVDPLGICLAEQQAMKHIAASRLLKLCAEAIVQDEREAEHLKACQECRMLLRAFGEDRAKYEGSKSRFPLEDDEQSKSA